MVAYLDSSVLLGYLLLGEITLKHVQELTRLVSSELLEIECRRVLLRCRMEGRFSDESLIEAMERLDDVLTSLDLLELSPGIKKRSMEAFPIHVKTLDALHLASALQLAEEIPAESITVFSHDKSFTLCARALGFNAALYT